MTNVKWKTGRGINRNDNIMPIGEPSMPSLGGEIEKEQENFVKEAEKIENLAVKAAEYFKVGSKEEAVMKARSWADFCDQTGSGMAAVNYDVLMHCLDDKEFGEAVYELVDLVQNDDNLDAWMKMKGMRTRNEIQKEEEEAHYFDRFEKNQK